MPKTRQEIRDNKRNDRGANLIGRNSRETLKFVSLKFASVIQFAPLFLPRSLSLPTLRLSTTDELPKARRHLATSSKKATACFL